MATIQELNEKRAATALVVQSLGMMNVSTDYAERLKQDARYRLARDANMLAERDYSDALAAMSSDELIALAT